MLLITFFLLYLLSFTLLITFLSINTQRIAKTIRSNPRSVTLLLPLFINFIAANLIFRQIHPFFTTLIPCLLCFFLTKRLQHVRIFGVCGGSSSGKSTLMKMIAINLKQKIMEGLLKKDRAGYRKVSKGFGNQCENFLDLQTEQIQRQKLIDFLYQKGPNIITFNKCICSLVAKECMKMILKNIWHGRNIMIIQIPMLCESNIIKWISFPNVAIQTQKDIQIQRAHNKWSCPQKQAKQRLEVEDFFYKKLGRCDMIIQNKENQQQLLGAFLTKINPYMRKNINGHHSEQKKTKIHHSH